jgi:hypothetical protein
VAGVVVGEEIGDGVRVPPVIDLFDIAADERLVLLSRRGRALGRRAGGRAGLVGGGETEAAGDENARGEDGSKRAIVSSLRGVGDGGGSRVPVATVLVLWLRMGVAPVTMYPAMLDQKNAPPGACEGPAAGPCTEALQHSCLPGTPTGCATRAKDRDR